MVAFSLPHVLCADDDAVFLQAMSLGLKAYGFEVVTALNGMEALKQFDAHAGNFVAVISDVDMPKMNGVELVKHLRAHGYRGQVVVMSGHWTPSKHQAFQNIAVTGFVQKPFEIGMLATLIKQAL